MDSKNESTAPPMRRIRPNEIVWGIDVNSDSKFPLVCGERYGVHVAATPEVCGLTCKVTGAIVYLDEETAQAALDAHPAGSMVEHGAVRRLRYRPGIWTRFVRADSGR